MTWTNAFDAGPCTVSVSFDGAAPVFSAVMAKGASQTVTNGADQYTIAVDANGLVSLTGTQYGFAGGTMAVYVAPADASMNLRIASLQADIGTGGTQVAKATGDWSVGTWDTPLYQDESLNWQPDPCDLVVGSPRAGIYAKANAS